MRGLAVYGCPEERSSTRHVNPVLDIARWFGSLAACGNTRPPSSVRLCVLFDRTRPQPVFVLNATSDCAQHYRVSIAPLDYLFLDLGLIFSAHSTRFRVYNLIPLVSARWTPCFLVGYFTLVSQCEVYLVDPGFQFRPPTVFRLRRRFPLSTALSRPLLVQQFLPPLRLLGALMPASPFINVGPAPSRTWPRGPGSSHKGAIVVRWVASSG